MMRMCSCAENARNNSILCLPSWHTSANSASQVRHHCQQCPWHPPLPTHLSRPSLLDLRLLPIDRYWKLINIYELIERRIFGAPHRRDRRQCVCVALYLRCPPTSPSLLLLWRTLLFKATCWSVMMFSCQPSLLSPPLTSQWVRCRHLYR